MPVKKKQKNTKKRKSSVGTREALTQRQKDFANAFIETGNATEAAKIAGYSERTARQIGTENLSKPAISGYIKKRIEEIEAGKVASADEVIKFYTSVMRGEVRDQFGLEASLADRLNAGKELMKRYNAIKDKPAEEGVRIIDDIPLEEEGKA